MLIRLLPEQITEKWEFIKEAIKLSFPPTTYIGDAELNNLLSKIVKGQMHVWSVMNDEKKVLALGTTAFTIDVGTNMRSLLIYSLFGFESVQDEIWKESIEGLKNFARSRGCRKLLAYTTVGRVEDIFKMSGGNVDYKLLTMEV